jgi:hypothetical protein
MTRQIRPFVHQLERRLDLVDAIDVVQPLQAGDHQIVALITHDRVNRPHRADNRLNPAAKSTNNMGDLGQLFGCQAVRFR